MYREIFEEFYDFSDVGNYKIATGPSGIIFTGINPNITFPNINIANVQEGGLTLKNQTLDLTLFSKRSFTICVVMQLWLNISMSIQTLLNSGAYQKPHLIYDKTTKKLKLQTNGNDSEDSITLLNSFNGKRVVFWLTKKNTGYSFTVKASISNHSAILGQISSLASQSNYTFKIFSDVAIIYKVMCSPKFYDLDSIQFHKIMMQEKLNGSYVL